MLILREVKKLNNKRILLNKILVIVIYLLLIFFSVASTSGYNLNDDYTGDLENINNKGEPIQQDKYAYAYELYPIEKFVKFKLDDPGTFEDIGFIFPQGISCGTFSNLGKWFVCNFSGVLWEVDFCNNFNYGCIGGGGVTLYGLSYNPVNNKLYGTSGDSLYEIDKKTGKQNYIASFGDYEIYGIAFDEEGTLFGWDLGLLTGCNLYIIDSETADVTLVGPLGIWTNYIISGHFDFETDILYLSAYESLGQLIKCDKETGECELVGNFESGAQITALSIPFSDDICPPNTTISFDPPEPDGENGWYVSDVNVTLNSTDDLSGVREIHYRTIEGEWKVHDGDYFEFILDYDCLEDGLFKYYAVDFSGNIEETKTVEIDIDQDPPEIEYDVEVLILNLLKKIYQVTISILYWDNCSGVLRLELLFNDELQETVEGPGPEYVWTFRYWPIPNAVITIRVCDAAGHFTDGNINGSDIHPRSRANFINKYSYNVFFQWLFNRFQLLDRLLNPTRNH
jgi:hypothetical protein